MKTKVTISTYKESGKWYDSFEYESDLPDIWNKDAFIEEAIKTHPQCKDMSFTLRVEKGDMMGQWLVKNR